MNRRELLAGFGAFALPWPIAQEPALQLSRLDHIEFYVSNVEKSRDFFVRVFGGGTPLQRTLLSRNNKRYLKLGESYMAFEQPRGSNSEIKVDHVSVSIKGLDMPKLHTQLEQKGIAYQDYPSGRDTAVVDPDGIRLQLSPENGWSLLNPATFLPEDIPTTEAEIFRPLALSSVLLNVKDTTTAVAFYQKIFGAPLPRDNGAVARMLGDNNTIWFSAGRSNIGLQQVSGGLKPGVHYFGVTVAGVPIDLRRRLEQLGAKVEPPADPGIRISSDNIRFRDPDGTLIQVWGSDR